MVISELSLQSLKKLYKWFAYRYQLTGSYPHSTTDVAPTREGRRRPREQPPSSDPQLSPSPSPEVQPAMVGTSGLVCIRYLASGLFSGLVCIRTSPLSVMSMVKIIRMIIVIIIMMINTWPPSSQALADSSGGWGYWGSWGKTLLSTATATVNTVGQSAAPRYDITTVTL